MCSLGRRTTPWFLPRSPTLLEAKFLLPMLLTRGTRPSVSRVVNVCGLGTLLLWFRVVSRVLSLVTLGVLVFEVVRHAEMTTCPMLVSRRSGYAGIRLTTAV